MQACIHHCLYAEIYVNIYICVCVWMFAYCHAAGSNPGGGGAHRGLTFIIEIEELGEFGIIFEYGSGDQVGFFDQKKPEMRNHVRGPLLSWWIFP
jgi:hypothetical protein